MQIGWSLGCAAASKVAPWNQPCSAMDLKHLKTYHGPNPFSDQPVIVVSVTRSSMPEWQREDLPLLIEYLGADPFSGSGNGEGIDPEANVLKLSRLLLGRLGGVIQDYAITTGENGPAFVVGFFSPKVSLAALESSVAILTNFLHQPKQYVQDIVERFVRVCTGIHPDYQADILMAYARSRDIPFLRFAEQTRF